jgi:F-type H+-transporting ATPase subunit b
MLLAVLATTAAEEHAPPLIDVDGTVLVQWLLFMFMLVVLSRLMFKPYLKLRETREKNIGGAKHEAHEMETKAEKMVADYEAKMAQARNQAGDERTKLRGEAAARERQVVGAARDEAGKALDEARTKVAAQAATAKQALSAQAAVLAKQVAKKLLGREVA